MWDLVYFNFNTVFLSLAFVVWFCAWLKLVWVHPMKIGTSRADQGLSAADDRVRCIWCQDLCVLMRRALETVKQNSRRKSKMADSAAFGYALLLSILQTLQTIYVMFNTKDFCSVDSSGVSHFPPRSDNLGPLTLMSPRNPVHPSLLLCMLIWSRSKPWKKKRQLFSVYIVLKGWQYVRVIIRVLWPVWKGL